MFGYDIPSMVILTLLNTPSKFMELSFTGTYTR